MGVSLLTRFLWRGIYRSNSRQALVALNRAVELQAKLPVGHAAYIPLGVVTLVPYTFEQVLENVTGVFANNLTQLATFEPFTPEMMARVAARKAAELRRPAVPPADRAASAEPVLAGGPAAATHAEGHVP